MKGFWRFMLLFCCLKVPALLAQQEDYPAGRKQVSDVYTFLKHLRQRGIVRNFNDAVLPIARKDIARLLRHADSSQTLTATERDILLDYKTEFRYDLQTLGFPVEALPAPRTVFMDLFEADSGAKLKETVSTDREKFLYQWQADSGRATLFMDLLFSGEVRTSNTSGVSLVEAGINARGMLGARVAYSFRATNGALFGDKAFALQDASLRQSYKLSEERSANFDFAEAVLKVDADIVNAQIARQPLLFGTGESSRILVSDNAPPMDAVRLSAEAGRLRYNFVHASLLGIYEVVSSPESGEVRVYTPKYFVLHRFDFYVGDPGSPWMLLGVTETVVYGNRGIEPAYLNPLLFLKSAEHSLWDRDNAALAFDVKAFLLPNLELYGTAFIDDIEFGSLGTQSSRSKFVFNLGGIFAVDNLDFTAEYTRIDPYAYSHRLPYNTYANAGFGLGHYLPPNSDELFFRVRWFALRRLTLTGELSYTRHGDNLLDSTGAIVKNVGGDLRAGFDKSGQRIFLDGVLTEAITLRLRARYEPFRNIIALADVELRQSRTESGQSRTPVFSVGIRLDY